MNTQIITDNGQPRFAVLPYDEYLALVAKAEEHDSAEDRLDYEEAERVLNNNKTWISDSAIRKLIS